MTPRHDRYRRPRSKRLFHDPPLLIDRILPARKQAIAIHRPLVARPACGLDSCTINESTVHYGYRVPWTPYVITDRPACD